MQQVVQVPRRVRGFAAMDGAKQRAIASKGGEATSQNREHMAAIGRRGGESISQNREHMAEIGRRGGESISQRREHMAAIGREGGLHSSESRRRPREEGDAPEGEEAEMEPSLAPVA